jgi:hypothetical protein
MAALSPTTIADLVRDQFSSVPGLLNQEVTRFGIG